jgi:pimeloyl-ACP methyl ester carboxylesterase
MNGRAQATMTGGRSSAGILRGGVPFNRLGSGPHTVVVFQGLLFENKPLARLDVLLALRMYRFLERRHTIWVLTRRRGLAPGTSLADMADDYAVAIRDELGGGPVDVIGVSTGGSIAQHFAADHPDLVRRLVIHSSAHTLTPESRALQMELAHLAAEGRWREAYSLIIGTMAARHRFLRVATRPFGWLMAWSAPDDPSDLIVTVEAEDVHAFRERLGEIRAPTLVVAGTADPFYTEALFRETAEGIPDGRLILYPGMGHPATGKRFARDVLDFLDEPDPAAAPDKRHGPNGRAAGPTHGRRGRGRGVAGAAPRRRAVSRPGFRHP